MWCFSKRENKEKEDIIDTGKMEDPKIPWDDIYDCSLLSKLAYEDPERILDMYRTNDFGEYRHIQSIISEKIRYYDGNRCIKEEDREDAQAYLWKYGSTVYICFRGTEDTRDILCDLDIRKHSVGNDTKIHNGFYRQFCSIDDFIYADLQVLNQISPYDTLVVCGHSLGGALATIAALYLALFLPSKKIKCFTFGCPRVGDVNFVKRFEAKVSEHWRITNTEDPVSMIPTWFRYVHTSHQVCIDDECKMTIIESDVPWYSRLGHLFSRIDIKTVIAHHSCKVYIDKVRRLAESSAYLLDV